MAFSVFKRPKPAHEEAQPVPFEDLQPGDEVLVLTDNTRWREGYVVKAYLRRDYFTHQVRPSILVQWYHRGRETWITSGFGIDNVRLYRWSENQ